MSTLNIETAVLSLFVMNLGIVFGAGLYEARIVVPMWTSAPPASLRSPDTGRQFWAFTSTIPLTLLTLASLAIAWRSSEHHDCWRLAAMLTLIERLATFGYFIPAMLRMQRASGSTPELLMRLRMWQRLNYARLLLTLVAWLAALKALTPSA